MPFFNELNELLDSAEVVAEMEVSGGLNAGNNNHFGGSIGHRFFSTIRFVTICSRTYWHCRSCFAKLF